LLLTRKLLNQGFLLVKLKSSLRKSRLGWPLWSICVTNDTWYIYICSTCRKPVLSSSGL
jgi:hypothetical protein